MLGSGRTCEPANNDRTVSNNDDNEGKIKYLGLDVSQATQPIVIDVAFGCWVVTLSN